MLPSLTDLSAKLPKPSKPRRRAYRTAVRLSEPIPQNIASLLFTIAAPTKASASGWFGQVRRLDLRTTVISIERDGVFALAIKKMNVTTEGRMEVAYNEYLMHRSVYACVSSRYPHALSYFTYPFDMVIPCKRTRPESRSAALAQPFRPVTIVLPEEDDDSVAALDEELLVTSCDSSTGYIYTVQSWGCGVRESTATLETVYTRLSSWELKGVGRDVGAALWYLHACGYMHNDLAMRNIVVCFTKTSVRAVIIDFGIASKESSVADATFFWKDMLKSIEEIYTLHTGNDWTRAWREASSFRGESDFVDSAYEAWSSHQAASRTETDDKSPA